MLDDFSPQGQADILPTLRYPDPSKQYKQRQLRVTFNMPNDNVTLKEDLNLAVHISKDSLSVQSHALIDITNLSVTLRQALMSHFTAYDKRLREKGAIPEYFINVDIDAGYIAQGAVWDPNKTFTQAEINHPVRIPDYNEISNISTIFHGQVVTCTIVAPPPNMTLRIECYTNQLNKATDIVNQSPDGMTFKEYVVWAGKAMGFDEQHIYCQTSIDNKKINNFGRRNNVAEQLVYYVEHMDWPNIAAYIDDNFFIVKNRRDMINASNKLIINQFVGVPAWDEWGVQFTTLFTPLIKLGGAVTLQSQMNVGVNGDYVIGKLEYELHSRDTPFYVRALALPPP